MHSLNDDSDWSIKLGAAFSMTWLNASQGIQHSAPLTDTQLKYRWMDGWLGFNGILSTQVAAISCLRKFKVC